MGVTSANSTSLSKDHMLENHHSNEKQDEMAWIDIEDKSEWPVSGSKKSGKASSTRMSMTSVRWRSKPGSRRGHGAVGFPKSTSLQLAAAPTPASPLSAQHMTPESPSSRIPPALSPSASYTDSPPTIVSEEELHAAFVHGARSSLIYFVDILSGFFFLLKKPVIILLVAWALVLMLGFLATYIHSALTPLCIFPGFDRISLCAAPLKGFPRRAEFPKMVDIQSNAFEQLLDESVGGSSLALEIKKAEMAAADLATVVRTSNLRSRDHLAAALSTFNSNAQKTARGLQRLNARVSGSVDSILAVSDHALQTIEGVSGQQTSLIAYIWPFGPDRRQIALSNAFSESLSVLSQSLEKLILAAEASLAELTALEEQLTVIHGIIAREDASITEEQSELLAALWTRMGFNRAQITRFERNLQTLSDLSGYRARALAHVVAALHALQTLSADMEELRERAAAPELSGGEIPIEVHAHSIRHGVQRLTEGRLKAKQIEEEAVRRLLGTNLEDF